MLAFLSAKRRGKDINQHETKQETWSHPNRSTLLPHTQRRYRNLGADVRLIA